MPRRTLASKSATDRLLRIINFSDTFGFILDDACDRELLDTGEVPTITGIVSSLANSKAPAIREL
jgi:hypothetical protein